MKVKHVDESALNTQMVAEQTHLHVGSLDRKQNRKQDEVKRHKNQS